MYQFDKEIIGIYIYVHTHKNDYLSIASTNSSKTHAFINMCEKNKSYVSALWRTTLFVLVTKVEHKLQETDQWHHELHLSTNSHHFDLTFEYDHHVLIQFHHLLVVENHKQLHMFDHHLMNLKILVVVVENFALILEQSYYSNKK